MNMLDQNAAEALLRQLRSEREALDRRIADCALYLELGHRLARSSTSPTLPSNSDIWLGSLEESSQTPRSHGRLMMAAAVDILRDAAAPLHVSEILSRLTARGVNVPGDDPVAALNTRLWKRSGAEGPFRRLGDAVYALRD